MICKFGRFVGGFKSHHVARRLPDQPLFSYRSLVALRPFTSLSGPLWKHHTFDVSPFGKLVVKPSNNLDLKVSPLNPQDYPSQDKVLVTVGGESDTDSEKKEKSYSLQCWAEGDEVFLRTGTDNNCGCDVQVPVRFSEYKSTTALM